MAIKQSSLLLRLHCWVSRVWTKLTQPCFNHAAVFVFNFAAVLLFKFAVVRASCVHVSVCVCVCVRALFFFVCVWERERECVCVYVSQCVCTCVNWAQGLVRRNKHKLLFSRAHMHAPAMHVWEGKTDDAACLGIILPYDMRDTSCGQCLCVD